MYEGVRNEIVMRDVGTGDVGEGGGGGGGGQTETDRQTEENIYHLVPHLPRVLSCPDML